MPQRSHRVATATVAAAAVVALSSLAAGAESGGVGKPAPSTPPAPSPSAAPPLLMLPDATASPAPRSLSVAQAGSGDVDLSNRRLVASVQKALRAVGFDPGPVDGLVGPRTRSAVRAYQEARGLPQDGVITKTLLASLAKEVTESR